MPQPFKDAVVETLTDRRMQALNFGYGPIRVYPHGYTEVANLVRDGHIRFNYVGGGDNSFAPDAPAGEPHTWNVSRDLGEPDGRGGVQVRNVVGISGRGTIVHEATHALQDFQRLNAPDRLGSGFTAEMAEGAGHIAGWIARFQWGWPAPQSNERTYGTIAFAKQIAAALLDGRIVYQVPDGLYRQLNSYAANSIGSRDRYSFHGFF